MTVIDKLNTIRRRILNGAATIAPGWQECTITSYGFRAKLFIRRLQIYPELLSVDCQRI